MKKKVEGAVFEVVAYETYRKVYRVWAENVEEAEEIVVDGWYDGTLSPDVEESQGELDIQEVDVFDDGEDY